MAAYQNNIMHDTIDQKIAKFEFVVVSQFIELEDFSAVLHSSQHSIIMHKLP